MTNRHKPLRTHTISIQWKIFCFLLLFCALLLLILWLFQVVFLDSFYQSIKTNEVKSTAAAVIKNIDNTDLDALVEQLALSNDVCLEVMDETNEELASADILRNCAIHRMPPNERLRLIAKAEENGGELLEYYVPNSFRNNGALDQYEKNKLIGHTPPDSPSPQQTLLYTRVFNNAQGATCAVLVNSVISPVNATVTTLRVQLCYITGFMVLFSVVLAFIIAKRVGAPIKQINESAKELARGHYDTVFTGGGYREISELSDTLNYTANELSKVEELRRELIANISHDLRTPLTLISGYAEAMRDLPDEMSVENAQIIVDETQRLTTLVNDALDISKLQAGVVELHTARYNLTASLRATVLRMQELVKKDGYRIVLLEGPDVFVCADETKISQAFYNLLINAIQYTSEDKTVYVRQVLDADTVRIEVQDTGEGIAPENLPYIWERYYKVDKTHKRPVTGTGLGLSIVKSILEMHAGGVGVSSAPGKGSIFWFSLKIA